MEAYFDIGKIVNTQGIKGDVRIIPMTDDPKRYELLKEVLVEKNNRLIPYSIEKVWYHKQFVIVKFQEIPGMTEAEKLKNCIVKIPKELALPLKEDEYFIGDLMDVQVWTEDGEFLGNVKDIIFTGSNDVYVIQNPEKPGTKELLIPAIKQCIKRVDIENKKMIVELLEGLRDE